MTKVVTRIKKSDTFVPKSLGQVAFLLADLGKTQNGISEIEKNLEAEIAKLKAQAAKEIQALKVKRDRQVNSSFSFANPRKYELTKDTRSTAIGGAVFGWRMTTPRVVTDASDEEIIARLKATGNFQFIRTKEEVDRRALLRERPLIDGISYAQSDEFFVVPKEHGKKSKTCSRSIDR